MRTLAAVLASRAAGAVAVGAAAAAVLHVGGRGVGLEVLGLRDPVEVAPEVLLELLALAVLLEVAAALGLLSLLRELSEQG